MCETSSDLIFSVVIPLHNEAGNINRLLREVRDALDPVVDYEVICVNDGSRDGTLTELLKASEYLPRLRIMTHEERCGQSYALRTGVEAARGSWIITLDGDGQDDPASIPDLINTLLRYGEGSVVICGHRVRRRDEFIRRLSSRLARAGRAMLLGDSTPDAGCGLKIFSKRMFQDLPFFDHMHRFLAALARSCGAEIISVPVNHRPRAQGVSHYGVGNRLWVTIADLLGVMWLQRRMRIRHAKEIVK